MATVRPERETKTEISIDAPGNELFDLIQKSGYRRLGRVQVLMALMPKRGQPTWFSQAPHRWHHRALPFVMGWRPFRARLHILDSSSQGVALCYVIIALSGLQVMCSILALGTDTVLFGGFQFFGFQSSKPFPASIFGMQFSIRLSLVFDCLACEKK